MKTKSSNSKDPESELFLSDNDFKPTKAEIFPENKESTDIYYDWPAVGDCNKAAMKGGHPPPFYTKTSGQKLESSAPPSYESLFGKPRTKDKVVACCKKGFCIIYHCWVLAYSVFIIFWGAKHLDDCPKEKNIPIWLLVAGVNLLLVYLCPGDNRTDKGKKGCGAEERKEQKRGEKLKKYLWSLLGCFSFAWCILGSVWVFRALGDISYDSRAENYCHPELYWSAFGLIIGYYGMCCYFCACVCCCDGDESEERETKECQEKTGF